MTQIATLPDLHDPKVIALKYGISHRRLIDDARKHGHYCKIGGKIRLTNDDVEALIGSWHTGSIKETASRSGGSATRPTAREYAKVREQLKRPKRKK